MRLKPKFRPNLAPVPRAPRARKVSGSVAAAGDAAAAARRIRTISGSSNASAKELAVASQEVNGEDKGEGGVNETTEAPITTQVPMTPPRDPASPSPTPAATILASPPHTGVPSSPILKAALQTTPRQRTPSGRERVPSGSGPSVLIPARCSVDSTQSLSPNFMHSPPAAARAIGRQRRLTETSQGVGGGRVVELMGCSQVSVYDKRKAEHKHKFNAGVPERKRMTMFDLIYYNPSEGHRMSNSSSRRNSRTSSVSEEGIANAAVANAAAGKTLSAVRERLAEEMVDDVNEKEKEVDNEEGEKNGKEEEEGEEVDEKMPVPQVKVGPNGEIIVDEESTIIETSASKKAKEDLLKAPLVFESANQVSSNYGSWGKKRKNVDWTDKETLKFYKGLSVFGTDFSMMESVFKRRSRHDLKMKFKREERSNRALVDKHLREVALFDASVFDDDDEDETDEESENKKGTSTNSSRKRSAAAKAGAEKVKRRRRGRRQISNRNYYSSSDDADGELSEQNNSSQEQSTRVESTDSTRPRRRSTRRTSSQYTNERPWIQSESEEVASQEEQIAEEPVSTTTTSSEQPRSEKYGAVTPMLKKFLESATSTAADQSPVATPLAVSTTAFPPGLLAANPGLANAVPGSLVVVASPSITSSGSTTAATVEKSSNSKTLHVFRVSSSESGKS